MKLKITILLLTIFSSAFGQSIKDLTKGSKRTDFIKYDLEKRRSFYPISHAAQVKLVSFHWLLDSSRGRPRVIYKIPLLNDTIWHSKLDEVIPLSQSELDTLTDILYNTCFKWTIIIETGIACYFPRNAIVFYDKDNRPFEYIELGLDCYGVRKSSSKIQTPEICDLMFDELTNFFQKRGLRTSSHELLKEVYNL